MIAHEKAKELPRPEIKREQCIEACLGCNKMFSDENVGDVCIAYVSPAKVHRIAGCALQSNKPEVMAEVEKKMNPLKASKRARRAK